MSLLPGWIVYLPFRSEGVFSIRNVFFGGPFRGLTFFTVVIFNAHLPPKIQYRFLQSYSFSYFT